MTKKLIKGLRNCGFTSGYYYFYKTLLIVSEMVRTKETNNLGEVLALITHSHDLLSKALSKRYYTSLKINYRNNYYIIIIDFVTFKEPTVTMTIRLNTDFDKVLSLIIDDEDLFEDVE